MEDIMKLIETVFVVILLFTYFSLWKIKELNQKKMTGINPKVMGKSTSSIQKYMNNFMILLTIYAVIIIILNAVGFQYSFLFTENKILDYLIVDISGFIAGLFGLSFCLYAQIKMGKSWRVGIDEKVKTELITTGLYKLIRNPTYLGLFILNAGIWLIWPTFTVFILNLLFVIFLEIQVRCEEDFLILIHGNKYLEYKQRTKRYIPFIY
jgi:protein-S-isoprenylcysteine O-methyltransferase Ste14